MIKAVIVHTCKELKRDNSVILRYDDNAAIVIDQEGNPKGTRIFPNFIKPSLSLIV